MGKCTFSTSYISTYTTLSVDNSYFFTPYQGDSSSSINVTASGYTSVAAYVIASSGKQYMITLNGSSQSATTITKLNQNTYEKYTFSIRYDDRVRFALGSISTSNNGDVFLFVVKI